ncbi:class I lanthipeptide [Pedobacter sp. NJ-S-72]
MKKVKLPNKIKLNKEVISKLNDNQLRELEGGKMGYSLSCLTCQNSCNSVKCETEEAQS